MLGNSKNNSPKGWFNFNFPKYTVKNHLKQIKACVQLILRHSHGTWPREANVMPAQIAHKPLLNTLRRKRQVYGFVVFGHPFVFVFWKMSTNSKALGWIVMGSSSAHRSTKNMVSYTATISQPAQVLHLRFSDLQLGGKTRSHTHKHGETCMSMKHN